MSYYQPGQQLLYYKRDRAQEEILVEVIRLRGRTRNVGWPCYEVRRLDTGQHLRVAVYSLHDPHSDPEVRS